MRGLNFGIKASSRQGAAAFDADYQAILDFATTAGYTLPSSAQQDVQNQLVLDLKSAGCWSEIDVLYICHTDGDSDYATINWKSPSNFQLTKINSPTFNTNQGFTGDGVSAYLASSFELVADGVNYQANSCSIGWYPSSSNDWAMGNANLNGSMRFRSITRNDSRINTTAIGTVPVAAAANKVYHLHKTASGTVYSYFDTTSELHSGLTDRNGITPDEVFLLRSASNYSLATVGVAWVGGDMHTGGIADDMATAINDYITAA